MLSDTSEKSLANLLMYLSDCEKLIESSRQDLASHPKCSINTAFSLISQDSAKISSNDLKKFIAKRSMALTSVNLDLLIWQYDFNNDGKLNQEEFARLLTPSESNLNLKKKCKQPVSLYLESLLARHIQLESDWQGQMQTYKRELFRKHDFSAIGAFRSLRPNNGSCVDIVSLKDFLRKYKKEITSVECERILRRIDRDGDGIINYEDFVRFVLPVDRREKSRLLRNQTRNGYREIASPIRSPKRAFNRTASTRTRLFEREDVKINKEILNFLAGQIEIDSEIEEKKRKLASNSWFRVENLFELFDQDRDLMVGYKDIEACLRYLQVPFHVDEIYLLIKHFSNSVDRKITPQEFSVIVLPYGWVEQGRKGKITREIADDLVELLKVLLRSENYAEGIRKKVSLNDQLDLSKAFNELDLNKDGVLGLADLENAFRVSHIDLEENALRRLLARYTKSYNAEISYSDFIQELTPKIINPMKNN